MSEEKQEFDALPSSHLMSEATLQNWLKEKLSEYLAIEPAKIDTHRPLKDYGLTSVDTVGLSGDLEELLGYSLSPTIVYDYPNIALLSRYLLHYLKPRAEMSDQISSSSSAAAGENAGEILANEPLAIVGMACRFPGGANTPEAFWQLLQEGRDVSSDVPLERWDSDFYYDPTPDTPGKMYTRRGCFVEDLAQFDASFFGISPREALRMDPQQRLLLEVAWQALENAGLTVDTLSGSQTGVFMGMMNNYEYAQRQIQSDSEENYVNDPYFGIGSSASIAAGRLPYLFDFHGPTLTIDTACSSSLVAIHLAGQSLRNRECNLALVGGVSAVMLPENVVNACKMNMLAKDGRCKTFDADADGFVLGEGCGIVVLKRLSDAQANHDPILAVIRGSAVNQDGRSNGITAPNRLSQEAVMQRALQNAGIDSMQVSYVEAHGSGTALGDPIEIEALQNVYGHGRLPEQHLLVGAVKTNIGHLAGAAGIAGVIKTVLALQHKEIPAHLNLHTPNPYIPWQEIAVKIPQRSEPWTQTSAGGADENGSERRIAGVSSFGWSGTNAHLLLEEAPPVERTARIPDKWQLLPFSAKSVSALEQTGRQLSSFLDTQPALSLADVAYTLQVGRTRLEQRRFVVVHSAEDAQQRLQQSEPSRTLLDEQAAHTRAVAFLLPGLGEQYPGMAQELYETEATFRQTVNTCYRFVKGLGVDIDAQLQRARKDGTVEPPSSLNILMGRLPEPVVSKSSQLIQQTSLAQPWVFIIEYALAQLLISWGIQPQAMLGYSLGEYVAACLADVLSLEDALKLVTRRAQLIQQLPTGTMLAVALSVQDVQPYLTEQINLAAVNAPVTCVLAGPPAVLQELAEQLLQQEIVSRPVATTHAFHSQMLAVIRKDLTKLAQSCTLHAPTIPYISNVTGTWITDAQATDPGYWAEHMCQTVQFADGVSQLLQQPDLVLLEVGVGQSLSSFVRQHPLCKRERFPLIFSTLPAAHEAQSARAALLLAIGRYWQLGGQVDWQALHGENIPQRIVLPGYPFERQRYWIESPTLAQTHQKVRSGKRPDIGDWFYRPVWQQRVLQAQQSKPDGVWLVFADLAGVGARLAEDLKQAGCTVVTVYEGHVLRREDAQHYTLRSAVADDYVSLCTSLLEDGLFPSQIVHAWSLAEDKQLATSTLQFQDCQQHGLYSVLYLAQALGRSGYEQQMERIQITILSSNVQPVLGTETLAPEKATILAACKVIPQEYQQIVCRSIDLLADDELDRQMLLAEVCSAEPDIAVAYRDGQRWVETFQAQYIAEPAAQDLPLQQRGVYLITGGLGGLGLVLAEYLAQTFQARLVLLGRSALPERSTWQDWLELHAATDPLSVKIESIQRLEALGAEVLLLQADVADAEQMSRAIVAIHERFGRLHGVLHAAGIFDEQAFGVVQEIDPVTVCEAHFQPKVYGTRALEQALAAEELDFCILFSSLVSVLGGLAFIGYTAANIYMDVLAHQHNQLQQGAHWNSMGWDIWQVKEERHGVHRYGVMGSTVSLYSMSAAEGLSAFTRLLSQSDQTHIVVSTGDLHERMRNWLHLESVHAKQRHETSSATPRYTRPALATSYVPSTGKYERKIAEIFQEELNIDQIGLYDNFFDLGGNSLLGLQVIARLKKEFQLQIPAVVLFEAPTVSALAKYLNPEQLQESDVPKESRQQRRRQRAQDQAQDAIAVVGMAGRFPGAGSVEELWQNICQGVESITFFSEEELLAAGVDAQLVNHPNYVRARPIMKDIDRFDATFFGYSPREAELTDPQHRLFLECAWEALELAGYDPYTYPGLISVFGGSNISTYMLELAAQSDLLQSVDGFQLGVGNDKDSLTTTVSYKLNLKGPSFAVQTFCSTSLVATHLACQHLLHGECDIALAGGVSLKVPTVTGYLYQEGGMDSPDGHCRTFDAQARGSIFGDGVAVVTLKRLSDALEDGDTIYSVIKGSAINNDGSLKVSYSAPSVAGQAEVVAQALANAGVTAESIEYVEAHGTATELGDPIEVTSLTKTYRTQTDKERYCGIGSIKTNIGHLDRAAGATGLIKASLALQREMIPPSLHYESPNPEIDFEHSPFYVNTTLRPWKRNGKPRRAGVNSLGMGGTNAHVILEEAPPAIPTSGSRPWQLLPLSARSATALQAMSAQLARHLQEHPELDLADVSFTLQRGRSAFDYRQVLVCRDRAEAITALAQQSANSLNQTYQRRRERPVAFLLPGVGEQYGGLARSLYQQEAIFRSVVERCCAIVKAQANFDLLPLLFPEKTVAVNEAAPALDLRALLGRKNHHGRPVQEHVKDQLTLHDTAVAQPAVFVISYALAQLLMQWGMRPQALIGYSLGEYVAACLSGVLSLEDALKLVTQRAQLIQAQPKGAMLAVVLSEEAIQPYLSQDVNLAIINAPNTCVLAGPHAALEQVEQRLLQQEVAFRRVETTHAFHSSMLAGVSPALTALASSVTLHPPQIPYLSNVTGTWITAEQATDPGYWARHMCQSVRFADGVAQLLEDKEMLLLEVGPGQSLGSFVRQHPDCTREQMQLVLSTLPSARESQPEQSYLLNTLGKLWLAGAQVDWEGFYAQERRQRIPLPTYPFERQRYWLEPKAANDATPGVVKLLKSAGARPERKQQVSEYFSLPLWKQSVEQASTHLLDRLVRQAQCWLIFCDQRGVGAELVKQLKDQQQQVVLVEQGPMFGRLEEQCYQVRSAVREDYQQLFKELRAHDLLPDQIVHLWSLDADGEALIEQGFSSLLSLAQALGDQSQKPCHIACITHDTYDVFGNEELDPYRALLKGPAIVIPQEYPALSCQSIDVSLAMRSATGSAVLPLPELLVQDQERVVALRGGRRWVPDIAPVTLADTATSSALRQGGVYLLTGGLGGIGLALAEHLAQSYHARIVLVGRTALPARNTWAALSEQASEVGTDGWRIQRILAMEAEGAEVLVLSADVADEAQMQEVKRQVLTRFGVLHGVFHLAGVPGSGLIQLKQAEQAMQVLRPKIQGIVVLERILEDVQLDFLALFSSITSMTGSPGQVDYCAANAFLDSYAHQQRHQHGRTLAIDWGEWLWNAWEEGMAGFGTMGEMLKENRRRFGLTFHEGMSALESVLRTGHEQIIVSTQEFTDVLTASKAFTVANLLQGEHSEEQASAMHIRPELETSYIAPRNDLERAIATLWEQLLGIEPVGIHDNFFDLGGNSLLGVDLIAHLRKTFNYADLPAYILYEAPTIGLMANHLEQNQAPVSVEAKTRERSEKRRENLKQRMRETRRVR